VLKKGSECEGGIWMDYSIPEREATCGQRPCPVKVGEEYAVVIERVGSLGDGLVRVSGENCEVTSNRKVCVYRGARELGGDEWEWCHFYNAKIGDVKCETCEGEKVKLEAS